MNRIVLRLYDLRGKLGPEAVWMPDDRHWGWPRAPRGHWIGFVVYDPIARHIIVNVPFHDGLPRHVRRPTMIRLRPKEIA